MKELDILAVLDNLDEVIAFVEGELETLNCPQEQIFQIDVCVEEIFSNIANYAYNPETGPATIRVEVKDDPRSVVLAFLDHGIPYDPLAKDDPDVSLDAARREIGGLGVYIVKKSMDHIAYEYKDGQNILTIKKNL